MQAETTITVGQRFERLTVTSYEGRWGGHDYWKCICDCGGVKTTQGSILRRGRCKSCGCLQKETVRNRVETHGLTKIPEHKTWRNMKLRCLDPANRRYASYGGRGITVCERWLVFENFYRDIGPRPSPEHSLERKDNDKGYAPENCIWATRKEQQRNMRSNRRLTFNGETLTLVEWSERLNMKYSTLKQRLDKGWPIEKAMNQHVKIQKRSIIAS